MLDQTCSLRLQLLAYDWSPRVIKLLRLAVPRDVPSLRGRVYAFNRFHRLPRRETGPLDAYLVDRSFNFVEIKSEDGSGESALYLSPNDPAWADTRRAAGTSLRRDAFRAGLESLQVRVALRGITSYPAVMLCSASVSYECGRVTRREAASDWVVRSFQQAPLEFGCFGAADFFPRSGHAQQSSIAECLDRAPGGCDVHKWKFDGLHDVMICPLGQARELSRMLGPNATLTSVATAPHPIGVVTLPPTVGWRLAAAERAAGMIAPPPERGVQPNATPANYRIYTRREYEELDARGAVPRLHWEDVVSPVLSERYTRLLHIPTDEVVVLVMPRVLARQIQAECERILGMGDDILRAHERIYARYFDPEYTHRIFEQLRSAPRQLG